jgi:hypothetical protein
MASRSAAELREKSLFPLISERPLGTPLEIRLDLRSGISHRITARLGGCASAPWPKIHGRGKM